MVEADPEQERTGACSVLLGSFGPELDKDHHGTYARLLEAAVLGKRNRNIARTGRFGTGKSKVLDAFFVSSQDADVSSRSAAKEALPGCAVCVRMRCPFPSGR